MSVGKEAFVMIDVQNDFCGGGTLCVPGGDEVVPVLNRVAKHVWEKSGWIFATRDWHPEKTKHFDKWPPHCVQGTRGAEYHPDLNTECAIHIRKGIRPDEEGYSDFEGYTEGGISFERILRMLGITRLFFGGLATDYCVKETALDARRLGFEVYLIRDACRAVNLKPDDEANALAEMEKAGVIIIESDKILKGEV